MHSCSYAEEENGTGLDTCSELKTALQWTLQGHKSRRQQKTSGKEMWTASFRYIICPFRDESFQAINCAGNDYQMTTK